ncbi:MAG: glycoside hydrolase family 25 protein [Lachnospiraceae bacterium]|nr:glycoside hydrolase family 25 protein [Lachnospiraceae bacterium]MBQ2406068.1 glycoside hydrolase family 25 protein [Lachnospiraceae bacterium]MEE0918664.1 glycoside hydrolase family 25 protein [Lachnospiraceae bacterium]
MGSNKKRIVLLLFLILVLIFMGAAVVLGCMELSDNISDEIEVSKSYTEEDGRIIGADLSAFLRDDDFFDKDTSSKTNSNYSAEQEYDENGQPVTAVSLLASSVEKDIRVRIVDDKGNIVTGHDFMIDVEGEGLHIDEDMDGVIQIQNVKPGDYKLSLRDMDGLKVPSEPVNVNVKSIVSYTTIEDIEYFVHSENEIDILKEDTEAEQIDSEDEDDTQYTSLLEVDEQENVVEMGIDVSKWNGEIDWDIVKAEGVDFAIIRCGYRGSSTGCLVEDPYYKQNIDNAQRAGVKVGVYFFTQATNLVEAVEEASAVITLLGERELDYPVFIDTEGAGGNGRADNLDPATRTAVINAFCQTIQNAGLEAGVYASRNWYLNKLNREDFYDFTIWLAEYRQTPEYEDKYDIWQYTSSGAVSGIEGRVDLNISYIGR